MFLLSLMFACQPDAPPGLYDTGCDDVVSRYPDADGDGHGDAAGVFATCDAERGVASADDCDDSDGNVYPGAVEQCDGIDQDCDGVLDNDAVALLTWYPDRDGDGYGDTTDPLVSCDAPAGYVAVSGDCDDDDGGVHPGADERWGSGRDEDCDGTLDAVAVTAADGVVRGGSPNANAGAYVSAGDLTGNGLDELVAVEAQGSGAVAVLGAPFAGDTDLADAAFRVEGSRRGGTVTGSIAANGDLDGDGRSDLLVAGMGDEAVVALFWGGSSGEVGLDAADVTWAGGVDAFSVGWAGDLDEDGLDEPWFADPEAGDVWVFAGATASARTLEEADRHYRGAADERAGAAVVSADLDGDGLRELIVGAPGADAGAGAVYVYPAWSRADSVLAPLRLDGAAAAGAGATIAAGDLDGDGRDDLVIASDPDGAGGLVVVPGPVEASASLADVAVATVSGSVAATHAGAALALLDIDGDDVLDVAVGGRYEAAAPPAVLPFWMLLGPLSGAASLDEAYGTFSDAAAEDRAGEQLAVGDLNGDGRPDLLAGGPGNDLAGPEAGAVFVFFAR